jgi:hypothetical protein
MYQKIKALLEQQANLDYQPIFFKTNPGEYSAHDYFLGISVPELRKIAKSFKELKIQDIKKLLFSKFNDERLLALFLIFT